MVLFGISREDYWYSRPRDLQIMFDVYNEKEGNKDRNLLEILRIQTFHLANLKPGTTYEIFSKHMPLPWDKLNKNVDVEYKPVLSFEESIKMQEKVKELLNKKGTKTKVPVESLLIEKT